VLQLPWCPKLDCWSAAKQLLRKANLYEMLTNYEEEKFLKDEVVDSVDKAKPSHWQMLKNKNQQEHLICVHDLVRAEQVHNSTAAGVPRGSGTHVVRIICVTSCNSFEVCLKWLEP
jgi:hypothetical protein